MKFHLPIPLSLRLRLRLPLLTLVLHLSLLPAAFAGQKALLVGINHYAPPIGPLNACLNDVALMRSVLIEAYGFSPENILVLTDAQVTAGKLTEAIKTHLIQGTQPEDQVVFFAAMHGTGVKDFDGDEEDGIDEALVTYDFDPMKTDTWFTDDLMFELFQRIPARQVLAVHDTCHSGTGHRGGPGAPPANGEVRTRFSDAGFRSFELDDAAAARTSALPSVLSVAQRPGHVFLGGCQDAQFSHEGPVGGALHGVFTASLARLLLAEPGLPLQEFAAKASEQVQISLRQLNAGPQQPSAFLSQQSAVSVSDFLRRDLGVADAPASLPASGEGVPVNRPPSLEEVAPGYQPSGNIGLALTTNKTEYRQNELMQIELIADRNAYVELYYYGVDDQVYRLFPNGFSSDNFVKAGEKVSIPGQLGFDLRLHLPDDFQGEFGNEVLKAVASTQPFTEDERRKNEQEMFQQIDGRKLNPAENRLIEVRAAGDREFGEAMRIYRIRK